MKYTLCFLSVMALLLWGCQKDDFTAAKEIQEGGVDYRDEMTGTVTDPDGNTYQWKLMDDGRKWMVENMRYKMTGSWIVPEEKYPEGIEYIPELYGRLYPWEIALEACRSFGNGWRLPSREHWSNLGAAYGEWDRENNNEEAYNALIANGQYPGRETGESGFNASLGGYAGASTYFEYFSTAGFYWTSEEENEREAHVIIFGHKGKMANDRKSYRAFGKSCRCVQDATPIPPLAKFSFAPKEGIIPLTINLDASNSSDLDGEIVSYEYDFGDGNTGSGTITSHSYTVAGIYQVKLTVTDNDGLTNSIEMKVYVLDDKEEITGTVTAPDGSTYQWKVMDDGAKWLVQDLTYGSQSGDYLGYQAETICHDVFGDDWSTPGKGDWGALIAAYGGSSDAYVALINGGYSKFNARGTYWTSTKVPTDSDYRDDAYAFIFSSYRQRVYSTDFFDRTDYGLRCRCIQNVSIPFVKFSATPKEGVTPLSVNVNASRSNDPDGEIVSYTYDFGDGHTGSGVTTSNTYTEPGIYQIRLTVTDNDGLTNATTRKVFVFDGETMAPLAKFSVKPKEGAAPLMINLDASASSDYNGEIVSYEYDFDDGSTGSGLTTSHTYTQPGSYRITLTVRDDEGYTGTTVRRVEVR